MRKCLTVLYSFRRSPTKCALSSDEPLFEQEGFFSFESGYVFGIVFSADYLYRNRQDRVVFGTAQIMAKETINIFLICDYPILRTSLRMLIESDVRMHVVGESSIAKMSPDTVLKSSPTVILCDLSLSSEKALIQLAGPEMGGVPVLLLTRNDEIEFYRHCLILGIKGLLSKHNGVDALFKAIKKVSDGEFWFDRSTMAETIRHMFLEKQSLTDNPAVQKVSGMTEREKQIIELICKGMKNKGIAEKLFITETTVRHHLTSVFNKLEVGSRLELVIYAFKNHLVKLPANNSSYESNGTDQLAFHAVDLKKNGFVPRSSFLEE